jgi:hypothetical protein
VRSLRIGCIALGIAALIGATPLIADAVLPPVGSTSPTDDLSVPVIPRTTAVPDAVAWLESAVAVRSTEVMTLSGAVGTAVNLKSTDRTALATVLGSSAQTLATLSASAPNDATLPAVRADTTRMIDLHIFAVLEPQVTEMLDAVSTRTTASQLLAQESSIRAAVAAAKSAKLPTGNDSHQLTVFHSDLVKAKQLVDPLPSNLVNLGSDPLARALSKISDAASAETTADGLVASARTAEQSIVTSVASRFRSKLRHS